MVATRVNAEGLGAKVEDADLGGIIVVVTDWIEAALAAVAGIALPKGDIRLFDPVDDNVVPRGMGPSMANLVVGLDSVGIALARGIAQKHADGIGGGALGGGGGARGGPDQSFLLRAERRAGVVCAGDDAPELRKTLLGQVVHPVAGLVQGVDLGQLATVVAELGEVDIGRRGIERLRREVVREGDIVDAH